MAQTLGMSGGMEQMLNPKMIAFYELLQQPMVELEQAIDSELQDNPALEVTAERQCPACSSTLLGPVCRECGYQITREDEEAALRSEIDPPKPLDLALEAAPMEKPIYVQGEEQDDVMARLVAPETLADHLRWVWRLNCVAEHRELGDAIIGCINEDGYLDTDLETLAEALDVPLAKIEEVLQEIQQLDPIGVGARTLRECLRLQLIHLETRDRAGSHAALALKLIDEHWGSMARHSYEDIAHKLHVSVDAVQDAADFIRVHLTPYPGRQYRPSWQSRSPAGEGRVRPDVVITKVEGKHNVYEVSVNESRSLGLRINGIYRQLWDAMRRDPATYSSNDREHVQHYLTRAREFIDNLNQRRKTLKLIIEAVAAEQGGFLEEGKHALRPLTRLSVAHKLGLHESTVGRAVTGKYALIPAGDVIRCEMFFDASLSVKEVIKDLLAVENPRKPYSDEQISTELAKKGINIARRTVTKYREALKVPPAAQRRRYN
ncbi:MAG TPA: RNA polymerase factor sigma-54 [Abditibacteriaceae bacterium]|nr:RNA polymerase factor sigma-54 [Abditibacteriaceae bacterium]